MNGLRHASLCGALLLCSAWASAGTGTILVFGDSLSAGYGLERGKEWAALLQEKLHREGWAQEQIFNASISGETSTGGLLRLPPLLAQHKPDIMILALGANDGLQGQSTAQLEKNLQSMVDLGKRSGAKVLLLASDIPPNYGVRYHSAFAQVFVDVAHKNKLPKAGFSIQEFALQAGMLQADGLHPSAAAQPQILQRVWPALRPLLPALKKRKAASKSTHAGGAA